MKVKIGDKTVDSEDEPILITLEPWEKQVIIDSGEKDHFCFFPTSSVIQDIQDFMKEKELPWWKKV